MSDRLISLFADVLQVSPEGLDDASSPDTLPEWDSMANMMLIAAIEETYDVQLSTNDFERMRTVGAVRAILVAHGATH